MKKYILRDVKNVLTGKTRNNGRYPLRIGKTFITIGFQPNMFGGYMGCFEYEDGHGILRTSLVQNYVDDGKHIKITTMNSIYYFDVVEVEE